MDISIKDTGIGIPDDQVDHIFNRFYQARGTVEYERKGSGIGLALTKELTTLHHGEIFANSREGEGTEFTVRLPLGDKHLKPEEKVKHPGKFLNRRYLGDLPVFHDAKSVVETASYEEEKTEHGHSGKNSILVVEDNADMRSYIREALESHYRITMARDGEAGYRKALEITPDLIISDVLMPKLDGYELCKALKNDVNTSYIPVILLIAKALEENIISGLEIGA